MSSAEVVETSVNPPAKKRRVANMAGSSKDLSSVSDITKNGGINPQKHAEIDEGLYSRQLYVLGHEAMRCMATSDILISGLGGLGVEVAKNVILGGVKSVTLHDNQLCKLGDLGSQFFLSEKDIGKNRAEACCQQLSELNNYVPTRHHSGNLDEEFLSKFTVIVITETSLEEQIRISEITHELNIALIVADTQGLFSQIFCDFGENFTVIDQTGEPPVSALIASVSRELQGVVTCLDDTRHGMEDGDTVIFSEVQGMTELNDQIPRKIKLIGPCLHHFA